MAEEPPTEPEVKWFTCSNCNIKQEYELKGKGFPFMKYTTLKEDSYIMKDPFSNRKDILLLGSDCVVCKRPVCQSTECSIFYKNRYCQQCAAKDKSNFPQQLHSKIKFI